MLVKPQILASGDEFNCDLLINAVGYEERARFSVSSGIARARSYISIAFEDQGLFSYSKNLSQMKHVNSAIVEQTAIQSWDNLIVQQLGDQARTSSRSVTVAIDISSMNRSMIASVFRSVIRCRKYVEAAYLLYSPAQFRAPSYDFPQIGQIGPVAPELSGYISEPSFPIGLLIGLGYDFGIAAGIMNRLEPKLSIAFRATGSDHRYEEAVKKANFNFKFGLSRCDVTDYSLLRPDLAALHVENILSAMTRQYRCILVPMGPKILSAVFILAGYRFFGQVAVWRVSEIGSLPHDAVPDGQLVKCEIDLERTFGDQLLPDLSELYSPPGPHHRTGDPVI